MNEGFKLAIYRRRDTRVKGKEEGKCKAEAESDLGADRKLFHNVGPIKCPTP